MTIELEEPPVSQEDLVVSPPATSFPPGSKVGLWANRRPRVSLQVCVDAIESVPPEDQDELRFMLPCERCPEGPNGVGACLVGKRKEIGPLLYDRELLTTPRGETSSLFSYGRLLPMFDPTMACVPSFHPENRLDYYVVTGWDIAWSEKAGGDYLAKSTGAYNRKTGNKRILDMQKWARLSFRQQILLMAVDHMRYGTDLVVIEEEGAQSVWIQEVGTLHDHPNMAKSAGLSMRELEAVPVLGHGADEKRDFLVGVPGLLLDIERKAWTIPMMEGTHNHEAIEDWLVEMEAFGWSDDKLEGVGEHDDRVMAFWHMWWGMERQRKRKRSTPRVMTTDRRQG